MQIINIEGLGSFQCDAITRKAVLMVGVSLTFYGFKINGIQKEAILVYIFIVFKKENNTFKCPLYYILIFQRFINGFADMLHLNFTVALTNSNDTTKY